MSCYFVLHLFTLQEGLREDWNSVHGAEEKHYACEGKQDLFIEGLDTEVWNMSEVPVIIRKIM